MKVCLSSEQLLVLGAESALKPQQTTKPLVRDATPLLLLTHVFRVVLGITVARSISTHQIHVYPIINPGDHTEKQKQTLRQDSLSYCAKQRGSFYRALRRPVQNRSLLVVRATGDAKRSGTDNRGSLRPRKL